MSNYHPKSDNYNHRNLKAVFRMTFKDELKPYRQHIPKIITHNANNARSGTCHWDAFL